MFDCGSARPKQDNLRRAAKQGCPAFSHSGRRTAAQSSTFFLRAEQGCPAFFPWRQEAKAGHSQGGASVSCFASLTAAAATPKQNSLRAEQACPALHLSPLRQKTKAEHSQGARSKNVLLCISLHGQQRQKAGHSSLAVLCLTSWSASCYAPSSAAA